VSRVRLHVLREPADTLAVALAHDDGAHEDLHRADALESNLALASCSNTSRISTTVPSSSNNSAIQQFYQENKILTSLVKAQLMPELVLAHGVRVVDLVAQHEEGGLAQVLHAEQRVKLGLALGEALRVLCVDEEHDAADFGEVVLPQAAGLLVAAQVEGVEAHAADGQLFGGRVQGGLQDCDAVILEHVEELVREKAGVSGDVSCVRGAIVIMRWGWRTVVLPALSRPRKSSLACLFASPSWASMSQTTQ